MTPGVGLIEGWLIVVICVTTIWAIVACWCTLDESRLRAEQRAADTADAADAFADAGDGGVDN